MEQFLLSVIVVLLLVLTSFVYLSRLIFRFQNPYPMMSMPTGGGQEPKRSSGGSIILIFALLLGLGYLSVGPSNITPKGDTGNIPQELNDRMRVRDAFPEREPSVSDQGYLEDSPEPVKVRSDTDRFIDQSAQDFEIDRYNQSPNDAISDIFFMIQISASGNEDFARSTAEKLSATHNNVLLVYIPEQSPFKIAVGPFRTKEAAKTHQAKFNIEGFIRRVEH